MDNCVCCHTALDANKEQIQTLTCAHRFHRYCLEEYMKVIKISSIADLPCPVCKLTAADIEAKAQAEGLPALSENGITTRRCKREPREHAKALQLDRAPRN